MHEFKEIHIEVEVTKPDVAYIHYLADSPYYCFSSIKHDKIVTFAKMQHNH